jgi:hypothetical protein
MLLTCKEGRPGRRWAALRSQAQQAQYQWSPAVVASTSREAIYPPVPGSLVPPKKREATPSHKRRSTFRTPSLRCAF